VLLLIQVSYASERVVVVFLYWNPQTDPRYCETCPSWAAFYSDFAYKNETVTRIWRDYREKAVFEWVEITSELGLEMKNLYNISSPNALVINGETKIEGYFNETYIIMAIETALIGFSSSGPTSNDLLPVVALAFSLGFFETFSPCLLALLSFILSYTLGRTTRSRDNFLQVITFGTGFLIAALTVGFTLGSMFISLQPFQTTLTWLVCVFALSYGFSMLGFFNIPLETKPLLKRITRKYLSVFGGVALLGFLFYFLDPCIAPFFFAMLPILSVGILPLVLLVFSLGILTPFVLIGFFAGSLSKFARITYKNKPRIRFASGLVLIAISLYIICFYLL
jgi:cytochrome c biogenesis protein CcdA